MAHEEAKIVRWHLYFKERDHVLPDERKRTWTSESMSKGLDSNVLIHSHRETWNAEVTWDACFKAYLQIGLTLCTAWVNVSSKDEIRTFWMHTIQSINTFLTENSVMTHFLKMKATIAKISNHRMIWVSLNLHPMETFNDRSHSNILCWRTSWYPPRPEQ